MSRRRSIKFLSVLAAASIVVAACGDDDDDDAVSEGTTSEETTAGTEAPEETTAGTEAEGTEPAGTEAEGTEPAGSEPEGAGAEVGGSACGEPHGPYEEAAEAPSGEVRVAWNQAPYSFNSNTNRGNATANNNPKYLMQAGGFSYYDQDLNYVNNDQFGTCTLDSLDPLTITYTINEGVTWSDGVQVDAGDMLIEWAAQSGVFNDADTVVTDTGETAQADPRTARPSSSVPTAPTSSPSTRPPTPRRSTRKARCSRATPTRRRPVSTSTRPVSRCR